MKQNRSTKETIITRYIEDELKESYLTYAMSVNTNRAIPDVKDGLKPSARRILYAMLQIGLTYNRAHDKSAAVVGEVMKSYHPHGDGPIYGTLVGMAQDFSVRYPLVDGQGNFGSIDADPPAAMRYTEARLTRIAGEMLADINKNTVDFQPNYKDTDTEPVVLPAKLPNLLVNGTTGIGVGYMTKIPPHNLSELIDGILLLLENPDVSVDELIGAIPGPDFPTAGTIVGRDGIRQAYATGSGGVTVRAKANIEREKKGKEKIIITEIPYQVKKSDLLKQIAELVNSKKITGISDIRDESGKDIRVVIELKRGEITQVILNQLYKHTRLQTNFNIAMLCLVEGQLKTLNLKQMLRYYLEHRMDVIRRRTQFDLDKSTRRAHLLKGYQIALRNIDAVIRIIENADSSETARRHLMANFKLSERQADAVLSMTLRRLTGLERKNVNEEHAGLLETIEELKEILASEELIKNLIKNELIELKENYGDERKTGIVDEIGEFNIEDLIADEKMVIPISHEGYIKRIPTSKHRVQRRGGVGMIGMKTKEDDFVEHIFVASNHQYILFFTDEGKCHWLKVFEIPEGSRIARGRAIVNLLQLKSDENITAYMPIVEFDEERYLFMATKHGTVKRCRLDDFSNPYSPGLIAITLRDDDKLIGVETTDGKKEIILSTKFGKAIRFKEKDVSVTGRTAIGVIGIRFDEGDYVVGMDVVRPDSIGLLAVTENGYGKRTTLDEYNVQKRGGKGVINIKTTERNGLVVGTNIVSDDDQLFMMSSDAMVTRMSIGEIRMIGRNTQGVRLMSLRKSEKIVDIAKISPKEEEEAEKKIEPQLDLL